MIEMTKEQHLKEIINEKESIKRTEKSKYFTEEFFELCEVKKYRNLFEEYERLVFKSDTFSKLKEDDNEEFKMENYVWFLSFDNKSIEEGFNLLMEVDEAYDASLSNEEKEKRGENYNPYNFTDSLIPICYWYDAQHIFISKKNPVIIEYAISNEDGEWHWRVIANNFDEFIDNLYVIPKEKKKLSEEEEKELREFVENLLEEVEKNKR